jgi:hypothetical protein
MTKVTVGIWQVDHLELPAEPGVNTARGNCAKRLPAERPDASSGGKTSISYVAAFLEPTKHIEGCDGRRAFERLSVQES